MTTTLAFLLGFGIGVPAGVTLYAGFAARFILRQPEQPERIPSNHDQRTKSHLADR